MSLPQGSRDFSAAPLYPDARLNGRIYQRVQRADSLFVLDIYAASEKPIEGINSEALAQKIREKTVKVGRYASSATEAIEAATSVAEEGDMILTLGAGSVSHLGPMIVERLRQRNTSAVAVRHTLATSSRPETSKLRLYDPVRRSIDAPDRCVHDLDAAVESLFRAAAYSRPRKRITSPTTSTSNPARLSPNCACTTRPSASRSATDAGKVTNAVLILHGTGGSGHQFLAPQFADVLFGPGQLLGSPTATSSFFPTTSATENRASPATACTRTFRNTTTTTWSRAQHELLKKGLQREPSAPA